MDRRRTVIALGVTILLAAGVFGGIAWAYFTWRTTPEHAPPFALESTGYENGALGDPIPFSLEDYRGKTVVLDFMAVSCATCRIVTAETLKPLARQHANDADFALVSIDVWAGFAGESRDELIQLQMQENTTWRHALDTQGLLQDYGAPGIPYLAVVDPFGRLVYAEGGLSHDGLADTVRAAQAGEGRPQAILQVSIVTLALVAGVATMFTPCAVGLLPGYAGQVMQARTGGRLIAAARLGGVAGFGVATLYVALAAALLAFGARLRGFVDDVAPAVALALIGIGVAMMAGLDWSRLLPARQGSPRGFYSFGLAYGFVSFGCTGPVFLPILGAAFLQGAATGALALLAYVGALVVLLIVVALAVASGTAAGPLRGLAAKARPVQVVSGLLMVGAGAYMLWFYSRAGLLP